MTNELLTLGRHFVQLSFLFRCLPNKCPPSMNYQVTMMMMMISFCWVLFFEDSFENAQWRKVKQMPTLSSQWCIHLRWRFCIRHLLSLESLPIISTNYWRKCESDHMNKLSKPTNHVCLCMEGAGSILNYESRSMRCSLEEGVIDIWHVSKIELIKFVLGQFLEEDVIDIWHVSNIEFQQHLLRSNF